MVTANRVGRGVRIARVYLLIATIGAGCREAEVNEPDRQEEVALEAVQPSRGAPSALPLPPEFSLEASPSVSLGGTPGEPGQDLFRIRGVVRLSDGRIFVADQANRVLAWDGNGRYTHTFGRQGQGPGEFRNIRWMRAFASDTLVVFDGSERRLSYFSTSGDLVRSVRVTDAVDLMADGSIVAVGARIEPPVTPTTTVAYARATRPLVLWSPAGDSLGVIATAHHMEVLSVEVAPPNRINYVMDALVQGRYAVSGNRVYVADSDSLAVVVYGHDGAILRTIVSPHEREPFGDAAYEYVASSWSTPLPHVRPSDFDFISVGRTIAPVRSLLVADDGNLWVEVAVPRGIDLRHRWFVFDVERGEVIGRLDLAFAFALFQVGEDFALGVARDALGVERVNLYELHRPIQ